MLNIINIVLHIDKYLQSLITNYGIVWVYVILFLIIFFETGLIITPFLPGDSLLFLVGNIAKIGSNMNIYILLIILTSAAILGDNVNYLIGKYFRNKILSNKNSKIFKDEYINKAYVFYKKHGGKAIFLSRFIPIIRTFTPNVAGIVNMNYYKFIIYNTIGAIAWIFIFTISGYFFGSIPIIKDNLNYVIIIIIFISIFPMIYTYFKK